jgi:hypothetical protein
MEEGVGQPVHTDMCTNEEDGRMNGGEEANGDAGRTPAVQQAFLPARLRLVTNCDISRGKAKVPHTGKAYE